MTLSDIRYSGWGKSSETVSSQLRQPSAGPGAPRTNAPDVPARVDGRRLFYRSWLNAPRAEPLPPTALLRPATPPHLAPRTRMDVKPKGDFENSPFRAADLALA